jgi:hypothetical protein
LGVCEDGLELNFLRILKIYDHTEINQEGAEQHTNFNHITNKIAALAFDLFDALFSYRVLVLEVVAH